MSEVLGIDFGSKRIGLARGNSSAKLAVPLKTLANDNTFWAKLAAVINSQQIECLVLGLPRGLDGQETTQTALTRDFAKSLGSKTGLPLLYQDEAATTVTAVQQGSRADKDSAAAALILQDYLDSL